MSKATLNNGESGATIRGKINDNFTEVYTAAADAQTDADTAQSSASTHASRTDNPHSVTKTQVGLPNVDNTSDVNKPVSTAQQAAINSAVTGLYDDRGNYNASVNAYPSSGGSGSAGAILKGDIWTISVGGTLPTAVSVSAGDTVRALVDTPGNTQGNWAVVAASGLATPDATNSVKGKMKLYNATGANTDGTMDQASISSGFGSKQDSNANLTAIGALSHADGDVIQDVSGSWVKRTLAQLKSALGLTGTNTGDQDLSGLAVKANNLSDLASATSARSNLGLGTLATQSGTFAGSHSGSSSGTNTGDQDLSTLLVKASNLSDLANAATARTNLGLGNIDNTSDTNKPVSTAQATAIALKADAANIRTIYNVMAYGAKHDYRTVSDAAVTSASATLTSATATFTSLDTGKSIRVFGAGAAGIDLITTVTFVNSTTLTLGTTASATISSTQIEWGTDDTTPIQNAINACFTAGGGAVYLPNGIYCIFGSLVTSVDGINPNCQIYFPLSTTSSTMRRIEVVGESVINLPNSTLTAQPLPAKGVILKSMLPGSGTNPSVIGSSFANNGATNSSVTTGILRNICIITKSITGAVHVAPTMSAFKLYNMEAKQVFDCWAMTESDPTESAQPTTGFGFWYSQELHSDVQSYYHNNGVQGYFRAHIIEEHDVFSRLNAYSCHTAIAIGGATNYNPVAGGVVSSLWCIYDVVFLGNINVNFTCYSEEYPGPFGAKWFNHVANVYFPSTQTVNGQINWSSLTTGGSTHNIPTTSGTNNGILHIRNLNTGVIHVTGAGNQFTILSTGSDVVQSISTTTTGRAGFYAQNTAAGAAATLMTENNRGSQASYGMIYYGGSTNAVGNLFGVSRADKWFLIADGASNLGMYAGTLGAQPYVFGTNNTNRMSISGAGSLAMERTFTAAGTTGAQTISKMSGSVNFAAAASTLVVTNTLVTTSSIVIVTVHGADATATSARVTTASGSFTITLNAAATAETRVSFLVIN